MSERIFVARRLRFGLRARLTVILLFLVVVFAARQDASHLLDQLVETGLLAGGGFRWRHGRGWSRL